MGLTGLTIFNANFSVVIIEGSAKSIKQYNRLMLVRIQWNEAAAARAAPVEDEDMEGAAGVEGEDKAPKEATLTNVAEEDAAVSLVDNRCDKIWEGPLRDRAFKSFKAKACPTDSLAKEALTTKWIGQWDLAKNFVPEDEL